MQERASDLLPVCSICLSLMSLFALSAFPQSPLGSIDVSVIGPDEMPVPEAKATAQSNANGYVDSCTTDTSGFCRIERLQTGSYTVEITKPGFRMFTAKEVQVSISREFLVSVKLQIGMAQERIEVTAEAPLLTVDSTEQSTLISRTQVEELPLIDRDFTSLIVLSPGVTNEASSVAPQAEGSGMFSVNGSRRRSNVLVVDGVDATDNYRDAVTPSESGVAGASPTILPIE